MSGVIPTYWIIGVDGQEYGPVTAEQVRQWLAEGRVDANTLVRGERGQQWTALGQREEFAAQPETHGPWTCPECGEQLEPQFKACWKCSAARPGSAAAPAGAPPAAVSPAPPVAKHATSTEAGWRVEYRMFKGGLLVPWEELFAQAADFAAKVGRDRLIGISHSADNNRGVVAVWYWAR